jgi:2-methylisocitrate lyase-like PEP mutase family enzyme
MIDYGQQFRTHIVTNSITPLIGAYDVFSATLAARHAGGVFLSGFGFAASFYGLPDIGFIAWADMLAWAQRVRAVLPEHHILVDIDDGYVDPCTACHVVRNLEQVGASGAILEDQKRPRRCGHVDGKLVLDLGEYLDKLAQVLEVRRSLVIVARTDATERDDILRRVDAMSRTDADLILADGMKDLGLIHELKSAAAGKPVLFNQIAGGKSPPASIDELRDAGVSVVIYSTPCLFAAHEAIERSLRELMLERRGRLNARDEAVSSFIGVPESTAFLTGNVGGRRGGTLLRRPAEGRSHWGRSDGSFRADASASGETGAHREGSVVPS